MVVGDIINGELIDADPIMNAFGTNFNDTAQMIFNSDYIGFDSRLANSGTLNLKNAFYSTFTSDDADTITGFIYDASNDLYEIPDLSGVTEYMIIEADDASVTWISNNTRLLKIASGKWLLYGTSGTQAIARAQMIKSLFWGTNGTNQLVLDFTNVTAIKTSHTNDIGKRCTFADTLTADYTGGNFSFGFWTGTFADTSTNADISSWSNLIGSGSSAGSKQWELPSGVVLHVQANPTSNNEMGTDTSADEKDNQTDCQLQITGVATNNSARGQVLILHAGTITWVATTQDGSASTITNFNPIETDFTTDNSIPLLTSASALLTEFADSTLIFKDTVASTDNAIAVINSTIDATSSEQISISANGGSNFTDVDNAEIARPTAGTELWRKIVITRTDLSKLDKVTEQAVKFSFY